MWGLFVTLILSFQLLSSQLSWAQNCNNLFQKQYSSFSLTLKNQQQKQPQPQSGFYGTQDSQIFYKFTKISKSKRTYLLIHGLGESSQSLVGIEKELISRGFSVLTVDLIGHGKNLEKILSKNSRIPNKIKLQLQAELLQNLIEELKINQFHILGHSYGGAVSIKLASHFKDRVQSLTLLATLIQKLDDFYLDPLWDFKELYSGNPWNPLAFWDMVLNIWTDPLVDTYIYDVYRKYFNQKYPGNPEAAQTATDIAVATTRGIEGFNALRAIENVSRDTKILIMSAVSDELSPEKLNKSLFSKLKNKGFEVDYVLLENLDHSFPETHPKDVVGYLIEGLK